MAGASRLSVVAAMSGLVPLAWQGAAAFSVASQRLPFTEVHALQSPKVAGSRRAPSLRAAALADTPTAEVPAAESSAAFGSSAIALVGTLALAAAASLSRRRSSSSLTARRARKIALSPGEAIPWWERLVFPRREHGVGITAEKINTTTWFDEDGNAFGATILGIKRGGNIITDKQWPEKHGLYSITVGYDRYIPEEWESDTWRRVALKKLAAKGLPPLKKETHFRVRPKEWEKWNIGDKVSVGDLFEEGQEIRISGISKQKGFFSRIKAYTGHHTGPMTHGSKHHRKHGSNGQCSDPSRVYPFKAFPKWVGGKKTNQGTAKILKIIDGVDEDNMPETLIVVKGSVPGYAQYGERGGSYVTLTKKFNTHDGRTFRDPVWMYYIKRGDEVDPYVPIPSQAWTWKTVFGRDIRWYKQEEKKFWPDGFPGYDHSEDPFYDGCDERKALKAPEW